MKLFDLAKDLIFYNEEQRYIVGGGLDAIEDALAEHGADVKRGHVNKAIKFKVIKVKRGSAKKIIEKIKSKRGVEYVEEDFEGLGLVWPNDPKIPEQWHLSAIRANEAWDITDGSNGPSIANIDSGVDMQHPDLAGAVTPGWDFVNNDGDPTDDAGHGTTTCGTAAAIGNNGIGVSGVTQKGKTVVYKVLGADNRGYYSVFANGITRAVDDGHRILSLSLGGTSISFTMQNAVNYAVGKGCIIIVAAGNSGDMTPQYPAACSGAFAVSASDQWGNRAGFSSYGAHVRVSGPGVAVVTTSSGGGYSAPSGTSYACPIVAGIAALIWAKYPSLTARQVEEAIMKGANDAGVGFTVEHGWGRVDAKASLDYAATLVGGTPPPPPPEDKTPPSVPTGLVASNVRHDGFTLRWNPSTDNVGTTQYDVFANGVLSQTTDRPLYGTMTPLFPDTDYLMEVSAGDAADNMSGLSEPLLVRTLPAPDVTPPPDGGWQPKPPKEHPGKGKKK